VFSLFPTSPSLKEFYGTVEWSVRGVFTTYLGWFGGDPSHLHPYTPLEYSRRLIRLSGGVLKLLDSADVALEENDPQWALHCSQAILRFTAASSGEVSDEDSDRARLLMLASLRSLASREISANGRNYFLTYASEVEGTIVVKPGPKQVQEVVKQLGAVEILKLLPLRLRSELCEDVTMKVCPSPCSSFLPSPFSTRCPIASRISSARSPSSCLVVSLMSRKFPSLPLTPTTVTLILWSQWTLLSSRGSLPMKETRRRRCSLVRWQ
jgi:hypothetical protein